MLSNPNTIISPSKNFPLGNITSYSANSTTKGLQKPIQKKEQLTENQIVKLKYDFKKQNIQLKKKIGLNVKRVSYCGVRCISKKVIDIQAVQGEKGSVFYANVQRCGCVWFCPDCLYKLMKVRAEELYKQLKAYKEDKKTVLFLTFTLQHKTNDKLTDLHKTLLAAFNFANSHGSWVKAKKLVPVSYLRTLEVLNGSNGWHPHLHSVFVGSEKIEGIINIFINLYKQELKRQGLTVNKHTVIIDKWNGKIGSMTDYIFKGMLEQELTGGSLKKTGKGKTFFELMKESKTVKTVETDEYIEVMKGKRQYHSSRQFFKDVRVKSDAEILKDDKIAAIHFRVPMLIYSDIHRKGIALHLLNEYNYGGKTRAVKLLELYDCDTSFFDNISGA